jgi:hypothetical protein
MSSVVNSKALGAFFTNSKFRTEPYENQRRGSLGTCKTNWKNAICSEEGRRCMGHPYVLDDLLFYPARSPIGYLGSIMWWIFVSTCYGFATWHFQEKAFAKFNAGQHI